MENYVKFYIAFVYPRNTMLTLNRIFTRPLITDRHGNRTPKRSSKNSALHDEFVRARIICTVWFLSVRRMFKIYTLKRQHSELFRLGGTINQRTMSECHKWRNAYINSADGAPFTNWVFRRSESVLCIYCYTLHLWHAPLELVEKWTHNVII